MKNNPKITLLLRSDKIRKDKTCPIYFNVRHLGTNYKFPSEYSVKVNDWNAKEKAPKSIYMKNILQERKGEFDKWIMKLIGDNRPITEELIKDFFNGKTNASQDFFEFYEMVFKENKKGLLKSTLKCYRTNINALKEFKSEISFNEIDYSFINKFDHFLRTERNLANGGRFGHHKNLRAILRKAVKAKRIEENPYGDDYKMPEVKSRTVWLNEEEVNKIAKVKIPAKLTSLINAREKFLFACYTGLRYSDIVSLEWKHIQTIGLRQFIIKNQVKTGNPTTIPISSKAAIILNRRKGCDANRVFENISNQKLNVYVKEVCRLAKINKPVTFHIARHSFASNVVGRGKDIYKLCKVMGHSTVKVTEKYAKLATESLYDLVAD